MSSLFKAIGTFSVLFAVLFPISASADTLTEFATKDSRFGRDACGGGPGFSSLRNYSDLSSTSCNVIDATEGLVKWGTSDQMYRTIEKFPTENLPDNAVVTAAEICHYYYSKNGTHNIGMTKYNGSSWTSAVSSDWGKMPNTSTGFPEGITRFSTSTITTGQYNCHSLDADGLGWISATGSLIVAFRGASDLDNGSTPGTFDLSWYSLAYTGTSRDPYIQITYTIPPVCGDGAIEGDEQCDDGNETDSDGCSSICEEEAGWTCTGEPSSCSETTIETGSYVPFATSECLHFTVEEAGSGSSAICDQWQYYIYSDNVNAYMDLQQVFVSKIIYAIVAVLFISFAIAFSIRYIVYLLWPKPRSSFTTRRIG